MRDIPKLVRTPDELRAARRILGLSAERLAAMVRMGDGRAVRRWETGESEIPGAVTVVLETAMDFLRQRDELDQQLEMMKTGKVTVGTMHFGGIREDNTVVRIAQLEEARNSLDQALAILTRQPPEDGRPSDKVHWYDLRRLTPKHRANEEDSWSLPGETSPEAALVYFVKEARLPYRLKICDPHDAAAEFILEQRPVLRTQSGASQYLRAGSDVVQTFFVKPAVTTKYVIEIIQRGAAGPIREKEVTCDNPDILTDIANEYLNGELGRSVVGIHSVRVRDSEGRVVYRRAVGDQP